MNSELNDSQINDPRISENSVTYWIEQLKTGNQEVVTELWNRFSQELMQMALKKMGRHGHRTFDEMDIANRVLMDASQAIMNGRFRNVNDRTDLWYILVMIAERRVGDAIKKERAVKRGGGEVRGESVFASNGSESTAGDIGSVEGRSPTPELAVMTAELMEKCFACLNDPDLKEIAEAHLIGYNGYEIAEKVGSSLRTIERRLSLIRSIWREHFRSPSAQP